LKKIAGRGAGFVDERAGQVALVFGDVVGVGPLVPGLVPVGRSVREVVASKRGHPEPGDPIGVGAVEHHVQVGIVGHSLSCPFILGLAGRGGLAVQDRRSPGLSRPLQFVLGRLALEARDS
jgi:hypothetical protein